MSATYGLTMRFSRFGEPSGNRTRDTLIKSFCGQSPLRPMVDQHLCVERVFPIIARWQHNLDTSSTIEGGSCTFAADQYRLRDLLFISIFADYRALIAKGRPCAPHIVLRPVVVCGFCGRARKASPARVRSLSKLKNMALLGYP